MKNQILIIHGGDTFNTQEEYLKFLENFTFESLDYFKRKDWKGGMQSALGDTFEVIIPQMPNKFNAKFNEWEIWLKKIIPFLEDGVTLVGHSMGGIFLAKYLSENNFPVKISSLHLAAAPFDDESDEPLGSFLFDKNKLSNISAKINKIFIYQSKDDAVVHFNEAEKYKEFLPSAELVAFENRGHINQESFPELVENIKLSIKS